MVNDKMVLKKGTKMHTHVWGPICHDLLLFIANSFSENPTKEESESMRLFIINLFNNLPCEDCKLHAMNYLHEHPIQVSSKKQLLNDIVTFHNTLNLKDGKKSDWTPLEALSAASARYFTNFRKLERAQQIRLEDHRLLQDVVKENNELRMALDLPLRNDSNNEDYNTMSEYFNSFSDSSTTSFDVSIVLIVVVTVILFFLLLMAFIQ